MAKVAAKGGQLLRRPNFWHFLSVLLGLGGFSRFWTDCWCCPMVNRPKYTVIEALKVAKVSAKGGQLLRRPNFWHFLSVLSGFGNFSSFWTYCWCFPMVNRPKYTVIEAPKVAKVSAKGGQLLRRPNFRLFHSFYLFFRNFSSKFFLF